MNLANVSRAICAQEGIYIHDLWTEVPELARNALLVASPRFLVRSIRIIEFLPKPTPRARKDTRRMRPQPFRCKPVAGPPAVVGHADRDVYARAIERHGQRLGDIRMKGDCSRVAVEKDGDPALAESVEADRPHPRFSSLKKSLPLSSMMMKAGKSSTSMRQIASMPSSGYSTTSTLQRSTGRLVLPVYGRIRNDNRSSGLHDKSRN